KSAGERENLNGSFYLDINSVNTEITEISVLGPGHPLAAGRRPAGICLPAIFQWLPLALLSAAVFILRRCFPAWVFMWLLAAAIFAGAKWLTLCRTCLKGLTPTLGRSLAYLLLWPGLDAAPFLVAAEVTRLKHLRRPSVFKEIRASLPRLLRFFTPVASSEWPSAVMKTFGGGAVIWL